MSESYPPHPHPPQRNTSFVTKPNHVTLFTAVMAACYEIIMNGREQYGVWAKC